MTAKELAIRDICSDLKERNKSFIAFRKELNSTMRKLVSKQIKKQKSISSPFKALSKSNTELVAHCFFSKEGILYNNYEKYYDKK